VIFWGIWKDKIEKMRGRFGMDEKREELVKD
jgi:hypothetical protein